MLGGRAWYCGGVEGEQRGYGGLEGTMLKRLAIALDVTWRYRLG